ncbi:MAG: TatD family hydrolase [Acidobacteriota bacterium]
MIDSHCHLADEVFAADIQDVVSRACSAGLVEALCVLEASESSEFARVPSLRAHWDRLRFAVGVHPHKAGAFVGNPAGSVELVRSRVETEPLVRAIGEIGLDYHYAFAPREAQQAVFAAQLALARDLDLPVIVHTREADADTIRLLKEAGSGAWRGVFHCFSGDAELARAAVAMGFHVSFSGIVTFRKAEHVQQAAKEVPADRLLIETDCPYLAPAPHRGKRNEPAWVVKVGESVAAIRQTTPAALAKAVTENYRRLFRP